MAGSPEVLVVVRAMTNPCGIEECDEDPVEEPFAAIILGGLSGTKVIGNGPQRRVRRKAKPAPVRADHGHFLSDDLGKLFADRILVMQFESILKESHSIIRHLSPM